MNRSYDLRHSVPGLFVAILFIAAVLIMACPLSASATAPKSVEMTYDLQGQELQVKITHASLMPSWHYIETVTIKKNGKAVHTSEYRTQPDKPDFTYTYKIEAAPGDVLEATASCSTYGAKAGTVTVAK